MPQAESTAIPSAPPLPLTVRAAEIQVDKRTQACCWQQILKILEENGFGKKRHLGHDAVLQISSAQKL